MSNEPLFDATRGETGVDPDKQNFERITENLPARDAEEDYSNSMTLAPDTEPRVLDAQDRCDRCGAQAYVVAEPVEGMELMFCAHHAREHHDAISAHITHDETEKLSQ